MCFALRVFHLVSPPCKLCRGELALHFCCLSGLGRAGPLKLLLNLLQPGLNSGKAEECELWLLPNLPQTVLMSSALASPRTFEPSTPSQGQDDETRTYPTSPLPQDGEGQPLWPHPFCSESLPLSLSLFIFWGGTRSIMWNYNDLTELRTMAWGFLETKDATVTYNKNGREQIAVAKGREGRRETLRVGD